MSLYNPTINPFLLLLLLCSGQDRNPKTYSNRITQDIHFNIIFPTKPSRSDHILLPRSEDRTAVLIYEGWNFNSGNYLFTTDTK